MVSAFVWVPEQKFVYKKSGTCVKIRLIFITAIMITGLRAQVISQDSAIYISKFIWDKLDTILTLDFSRIDKPDSPDSFKSYFHFPPIRQDTAGTCWAFSGISFLESELYRIYEKKIKLSEMYIVYWEYIEKARHFIREKGRSHFGQGSQERAVLLRMKQYGIVRAEDYSGLTGGETVYNHDHLFREMKAYLDFLKANNVWDEELALSQIRMILSKYMGEPPPVIQVKRHMLTPKQYFDAEIHLPLEAYVSFMSFSSAPFYELSEYKVEDNWWHDRSYFNVPFDDWYRAVVTAIQSGYTVGIGGDVSEPGKGRWNDVCLIPSFDIPSEAINQSAREFRFYNKTSTDDHGVHLVGYQKFADHDWFLIKDSSSSGYAGKFPGYFFYRDDFVRLKMLTFIVHRDAVQWLLEKCKTGVSE
jgi:bleomycin hydrolase